MLSWLLSHAIQLAHGLSAALVTIGLFYVVGSLLVSERRPALSWSDAVIRGLVLYLALCWIGVSARHIPVMYIAIGYIAFAWLLVSLRFQLFARSIKPRVLSAPARSKGALFVSFYVLLYVLLRPAAGSGVIPLAPAGNVDLITYARYARQVLEFGTPAVERAPFVYGWSPASADLLAWQSLLFNRDSLEAALPTLLMAGALFGLLAVDVARTVFRLSWRVSIVVGVVGLCSPMFRWALASSGLSYIVTSVIVLYLFGLIARAAMKRSADMSSIVSAAAGVVALWCVAPPTGDSLQRLARVIGELVSAVSTIALGGLPHHVSLAAEASRGLRPAVVVAIAAVPVLWGGGAYLLRRAGLLERENVPSVDRRLTGALVIYVGVGVVIGNIAVHLVRTPAGFWRTAAWAEMARLPVSTFGGLTLKVADEPDNLSTALALYYLPGKKADVFGRGVSLEQLPFESVSKQQPMFIQNFSCDGVGHPDTLSVRGVGCVLMAPPGMVVGTSYPFNRTFLFLTFDRMTIREPGGRWNTRPTLNLRVTADPQQASLTKDVFMNLLVHPFLPPDVKPQTLTLTWGSGHIGTVVAKDRMWFSFPVQSGDWQGNRLWALPIRIDFSTDRTILFQEIALTETPKGEVVTQPRSAAAGG